MIHRQIMGRYRSFMRRAKHFVVHNLLHVDDPPHRLALGVAIGMFVTFTPTVGLQMVLTLFLAWLLGGNKVVGLPLVWISNPATLVPIFYSCYLIGCMVTPYEAISPTEWWDALSQPPAGWWPKVSYYWTQLMDAAVPLWVGGCVVGLATAIPSYYATYFFVIFYRLRRWGSLTPHADAAKESKETDATGDVEDEAA